MENYKRKSDDVDSICVLCGCVRLNRKCKMLDKHTYKLYTDK